MEWDETNSEIDSHNVAFLYLFKVNSIMHFETQFKLKTFWNSLTWKESFTSVCGICLKLWLGQKRTKVSAATNTEELHIL